MIKCFAYNNTAQNNADNFTLVDIIASKINYIEMISIPIFILYIFENQRKSQM